MLAKEEAIEIQGAGRTVHSASCGHRPVRPGIVTMM
jgi:hypothetical protein